MYAVEAAESAEVLPPSRRAITAEKNDIEDCQVVAALAGIVVGDHARRHPFVRLLVDSLGSLGDSNCDEVVYLTVLNVDIEGLKMNNLIGVVI